MKHTIKGMILILGLTLLLVTSCTPGIQVLFEETTGPIGMPIGDLENFVVRDEKDLQDVLDIFYANTGTTDAFDIQIYLPRYDFDQKTLLGQYTTATGCHTDFKQKVFRDDENKIVTYQIKVVERGNCKALSQSMNWILVDKMPEDYHVEFLVK